MAPIRLSLRKNFLAIGKFQSWHILHDINRTQLSRLFMWGFCAFLSAGLLLIATKSSPLYPLNDWPDANTFFSIGKGMMNGLVPYRDLFEQKGPLLYFFHGVASLISQRSFMGVYILEVLSFSVFLYFAQKSLSLFVPVQYSLFALPILAASVLNLRSFAHGDTAESYVFPFMMFSLYTLLRHFKEHEPEPMPPKVQLLNGVMAGCVMWIKYAFLGFWFGWLLTVVAAQIGK